MKTSDYALFTFADELHSLAESENDARRIVAANPGAGPFVLRYWLGTFDCGKWTTLYTIPVASRVLEVERRKPVYPVDMLDEDYREFEVM